MNYNIGETRICALFTFTLLVYIHPKDKSMHVPRNKCTHNKKESKEVFAGLGKEGRNCAKERRNICKFAFLFRYILRDQYVC